MKRVLIGSCGGLTGYFLAKQFKLYSNLDVWGMDAENPRGTGFIIDDFLSAPASTNEDDFISFLIENLNRNCIDYYFPTHSKEILMISKYEEKIREKTDTNFIVSPYKTFQALNKKLDANRNLKEIGLNVPKVYTQLDQVIYPAFCKPNEASGSKNAFVINNYEEYKVLKKMYSDLQCMEYLSGDEYTVDAVFDSSAKLISYNQRIRIRQQGGATIYTKNDFSVDVYEDLVKISQKFPCKGVVNFQFFLNEGKVFYTDINLRYASGGLPLSVESGIHIVPLLLDILDNNKIDYQKYKSDRKKRTMYRCYEERFQVEE